MRLFFCLFCLIHFSLPLYGQNAPRFCPSFLRELFRPIFLKNPNLALIVPGKKIYRRKAMKLKVPEKKWDSEKQKYYFENKEIPVHITTVEIEEGKYFSYIEAEEEFYSNFTAHASAVLGMHRQEFSSTRKEDGKENLQLGSELKYNEERGQYIESFKGLHFFSNKVPEEGDAPIQTDEILHNHPQNLDFSFLELDNFLISGNKGDLDLLKKTMCKKISGFKRALSHKKTQNLLAKFDKKKTQELFTKHCGKSLPLGFFGGVAGYAHVEYLRHQDRSKADAYRMHGTDFYRTISMMSAFSIAYGCRANSLRSGALLTALPVTGINLWDNFGMGPQFGSQKHQFDPGDLTADFLGLLFFYHFILPNNASVFNAVCK